MSVRQFVDSHFSGTEFPCGDGRTCHDKVLKSAMVGTTYYGAIERTYSDGARQVWATVWLTSTKRDGCYDTGYKDMDETVGPVESNCPAGILDLLTEPDSSSYAPEWRARCRENIKTQALARQLRGALRPGMRITTKAEIHFTDGHKAREFTVDTVKRPNRRWRTRPDGTTECCGERSVLVYRSAINGRAYRIGNIHLHMERARDA